MSALIPKPLTPPEWRAPDKFGSIRVNGRLLPTYLHAEIRCESDEMNALLRMTEKEARWFWFPDAGMMPDERGVTGAWIFCWDGFHQTKYRDTIDGSFAAKHSIKSVTEPYWEPYWMSAHPLFPRVGLDTVEQLEIWMKISMPVFHDGDTADQRSNNAGMAIINAAEDLFVNQFGLKNDAELKYEVNKSELIAKAQCFMYAQSADDRKRFILAMDRELVKREEKRRKPFEEARIKLAERA